MLAGLFEEEHIEVRGTDDSSSKKGPQVPPNPRLQCGLCGISNQGATCYLNSLLQTLLLTPEFRELLFELGEDELGNLKYKDIPGVKVRVIPIQLQRLFARLLLSDQQSVSTTDLTESFGWSNNEGYQQHDVQELNRILFSAIEDSLVGTSGRGLINRLYHGTIVNQIRCKVCGKVSEREEKFLDLTISISGLSTLEKGLQCSFIDQEMMDGKNQYRCERCNKLVDASKGAQLRCLPEVLTISLLRFSYDFVKQERFKETGKFVYPMVLDMSPYYECVNESESYEYELFSVVIHKGGAYGGHYHAYIRDIDGLGNWTHPEEESIQIPTDPTTGEVDFIECDCPVELIQAILHKNKDIQTVDKLCAEITKQTGVSWNKRFKKQFGPIHKFLSKNDDKFIYDCATNHISLKNYGTSPGKLNKEPGQRNTHNQSSATNTDSNQQQSESSRKKRSLSPSPEKGHCWFDFNDSRVYPIRTKEIERQYSGKESAYMLFYRKKYMSRPAEALGNPAYKMPEDIITEVLAENDGLQIKRQEYDVAMNMITVQLHFGDSYQYISGGLQPLPDRCNWIDLSIDRRKTVTDLKLQAMEVAGELLSGEFVIHRMKDLPAGGHLYDIVSVDNDRTLVDLSIDDGTKLFIWNGQKVCGEFVPTGVMCEPVKITVIYGNPEQINYGFSKSLTLDEFKIMTCELCGLPIGEVKLRRVINETTDEDRKIITFTEDQYQKTLEELKIKDGDQILLEETTSKNKSITVDRSVSGKSKILVHVENKCIQSTTDKNRNVCRIEIEKNDTIGVLKVMAMTKFGLSDVDGGGRLRIEHDSLGLRPPLHEDVEIDKAGIVQGCNLVLEPGTAPTSNQITVTFTPGDPRSDLPDREVIVDRNITVEHCLQCLLNKAGYNDDGWHLRKTNWCGEAAEILDDLESTLEQTLVKDGDHLLLEKGKLPPKGYVRVPIWLYPTPDKPFMSHTAQTPGMLSWITTGLQGLLSRSDSQDQVTELDYPVYLGEVEVSLTSILEDLKIQILTLPGLENLSIPSPDFLRVCMVEDGRLSTVLKDPNQTLQKLKVKTCNKLAIQILSLDEQLSINQIVLNTKVRIPDTRTYAPEVEAIWDVSQGATVQSLKKTLADSSCIPIENLKMAKHFPKRFEWMVIKEVQKKPTPQKGKKKSGQKSNLRQAPYNIQDGDTIGIMNLQFHPMDKDDFCTIEDDIGQEEIKRQAEEKRKEREEKKKREAEFDGFQPKSRRPEVALTIKVDDFR